MKTLYSFLLVAAGGAAGSALRYAASLLLAAVSVAGVWPTLAVNAAGSLLIGLLSGWGLRGGWSLLAVTGLCGGFTTYSTFSLQTVALLQEGRWAAAAGYAAGTLALCLGATWLGLRIAG